MSVTTAPSDKLSLGEILERALGGERISDEDAVALLRSRNLVAVGRVANEIRNRLNDSSRVTFIVDRNLNYTNVCVTDCDFCAFYRRPGDQREGYLLPKPVIYRKIEETLAIGGTGVLMQGGHHPDLGVDYYEDLFSSIKARYQDPSARALPAGDPAHRPALEAHDPETLARLATPASTRFRAEAPRSSSTACGGSLRPRRRRPTSGSTSCARRTGSGCRRPRR